MASDLGISIYFVIYGAIDLMRGAFVIFHHKKLADKWSITWLLLNISSIAYFSNSIFRPILVSILLFQNRNNITIEMLSWIIFILIAASITSCAIIYYTYETEGTTLNWVMKNSSAKLKHYFIIPFFFYFFSPIFLFKYFALFGDFLLV